MLSLQELRDHPGINLLEETETSLHFTVQSHSVVSGRIAHRTLEFHCPVIQGLPLLARSAVTLAPGETCPPCWDRLQIEETLRSTGAGARMAHDSLVAVDREQEKMAAIARRRAELKSQLSGLFTAFVNSGDFPDVNIAKTSCLSLCGEVILSIQPDVQSGTLADDSVGDPPAVGTV